VRPLSAAALLALCEGAAHATPAERASALAEAAAPELNEEEVAALTIGTRDALVLDLRETTLGSTYEGWVECPSCAQRLEFAFAAPVRSAPVGDQLATFETGATGTFCRLPTTADARAISRLTDEKRARREIARRCIADGGLEPDRDPGERVDEVATALASEVAERDPLSDSEIAIGCDACGEHFAVPFDPATFFWSELIALRNRILHEVHTLASAYGWAERDILAMSPVRRLAYLELVP
jgi:hypothetical protein